MSNESRSIFPGIKARKPQYVLGTENGTRRTSNVTEAKIVDAIDDIEDNVAVYLEKCVPVVLVRHAEAYSIDYFKDCSIAVCLRVKGYLFRMWRSDVYELHPKSWTQNFWGALCIDTTTLKNV